MIVDLARREYLFKKIGSAANHCTYCPKLPQECCPLSCQGNYDNVQRERQSDGIIVDDDPIPTKVFVK